VRGSIFWFFRSSPLTCSLTSSSNQEVVGMSILELFCSVDDFWQRFDPS
jgi:hypothetical protein